MHAKRKQIRRRAASDSDDSGSNDGHDAHASAIAAAKAKRQPVSRVRKPGSVAAFAHNDEDADSPLEVSKPTVTELKPVEAIPLREPVRTVERNTVNKPAASLAKAPAATSKPRSGASLTELENSIGFEPTPEFIPLDASRRARPSSTAFSGRSKLEAMVYSSGDEDEGADAPTVVGWSHDTTDVDMENDRLESLRAVRSQVASRSAQPKVAAAPHRPGHVATAPPVHSLGDVLDKYDGLLGTAKEMLEQDNRDLNRLQQELSASQNALGKVESDVATSAAQYEFFQSTRQWIRSLCGFLTTKMDEIASLETAVDTAEADAAIAAGCRRAADLLDEINECTLRGCIVISYSGDRPDMPVEAPPGTKLLSVGMVWGPEGRILKRRQRLAALRETLASVPADVLSTDTSVVHALSDCDDSESESQISLQRRVDVLQPSYDLFSDALPEYGDIRVVRDRFIQWKNTFHQSYEDAYISLSLHEVFAPFVRAELLSWSPCTSITLLNEFEWFPVVWELVEAGADLSDRLVPTLVSNVLLPRLASVIKSTWNPLSSRQCENLQGNLKELLTVEPSGDAIQEVTQALVGKIRLTCNELCVPVIVESGVLTDVSKRHFARCCKLLSLLSRWESVVTTATLVDVGLNEIVSPLLIPVVSSLLVQVDTVQASTECLCLILESVPATWKATHNPTVTSLKDLACAVLACLSALPTPTQHLITRLQSCTATLPS